MEKDYKKLYEEASERARKMIFNNPETSGIIKEVFPEVLEETEDERIKRLRTKGFNQEWTIEDAAEGDLLVCYNPELNKVQYGIFKYYNSSFDHDNITCFKASIGLAWDGKLIINDYMGGSVVHPATIEQREQFKLSLKDNIRDTINQRPIFNIGDTIIHKELGGDYIHEPHKIVRINMLNKKYYSEDGYSVKFSEQDDYELFI